MPCGHRISVFARAGC
ncbi:MAG: hypothetical protein ACLFUL_02575 [Desulfobacteraceae bacterium]